MILRIDLFFVIKKKNGNCLGDKENVYSFFLSVFIILIFYLI